MPPNGSYKNLRRATKKKKIALTWESRKEKKKLLKERFSLESLDRLQRLL